MNFREFVSASVIPFSFIGAVLLAACGGSESATQSEPTPQLIEPIASLSDGQWLKGDLHVHSDYSSDASNNPVRDIVQFAERAGMDFLAITDHDNHVNGDIANNTWADPAFVSDQVILLFGSEWTTSRGHGNTFSARPYDHAAFYAVRDETNEVIGEKIRELGIHLSANHPGLPNSFEFNYDIAQSIEVWSTPIWALNSRSEAIWEELLSVGRRITAIGGSDSHHGYPTNLAGIGQNSYQRGGNYVGTPTTWAFARSRDGDAVIGAFRNGRVSVSVNPNSPRVELFADVTGDGEPDLMMGDNARADGAPVRFIIRLENLPALPAPYSATVIRNGVEFDTFFFTPGQAVVTFEDAPSASERTYYRVKVTGVPALFPEVPVSSLLSVNMVALSNPIYFNFGPRLP